MINIFLLMFVDDMVLIVEIFVGLQSMLNIFNEYIIEWDLNVNVFKIKVVIFRNGGKMLDFESWLYNE